MPLASDSTFTRALICLVAIVAAWEAVTRVSRTFVAAWNGNGADSARAVTTPRLSPIVAWALRRPLVAIAAVAAIARIVPSLALDRGLPFDVNAHWWVGTLNLAGQDIYTAPLAQGRYPYPPLHMLLSALMVHLSGGDRARFLLVDKLLPGLCGVALAIVVWAAAVRLGQSKVRALQVGLLYAINPIAVLVTAYHGQFDEVPVFCIALAFLLILPGAPALRSADGTPAAVLVSNQRENASRERARLTLSALVLGMAVAYKAWPLLFLPGLLVAIPGGQGRHVWWRRLAYPALVLVPAGLSIAVYGLAFGGGGVREAFARLRDYHGSDGFCWGYVSVIHECWIHPAWKQHHTGVLALNKSLLVAGLLIVGLVVLWRRRPLEALVIAPLAFLLFTPGWGPNYTLWVLPFALLYSPPLAQRYTIAVLPLVAVTYLDSLYAAYAHVSFSWTVLKPLEAALGVAAWAGVGALFVWIYASDLVHRVMMTRQVRPRGRPVSTAAVVESGSPSAIGVSGSAARQS